MLHVAPYVPVRPLPLEVARRLAQRAMRRLRRPSTWLAVSCAAALAVLAGGLVALGTPASASLNAADQYVRALQSGDADTLLSSLAPEARLALLSAGRQVLGPAPEHDTMRAAAALVVRADRIERYWPVGRYEGADGRTLVFYATERLTDAGEREVVPLVVWLNADGQVIQATT